MQRSMPLGRAIAAATAAMGPGAASGELPGLRYGVAGAPIPSFNRLMVTRRDPPPADRDIDAALAALAARVLVRHR